MRECARRNSRRQAFTLIELLVVIAIFAIIAAMLMPELSRVITRAKIVKTQKGMGEIVRAITRYDATYSRYPTTMVTGKSDFTYGGSSLDSVFGNTGAWSTNNSEVIAILMDLERYPSGTSNTVNFGHVNNTQRVQFLNAKMVGDSVSPGVGQDLVYRDPWSNP